MTDSSYVAASPFLSSLLSACTRAPDDKANGYAIEALEQHGVSATLDKGTQTHLQSETGELVLLDWTTSRKATQTVARLGELLGY